MGSYLYKDILEVLKSYGHEVRTVYYHFADRFNDDFFVSGFSQKLKSDSFELVFSVNFFPLVASICHENNIPYISWTYDSPLAEDLEKYFDYETNYIYLFDKAEVENYKKAGHTRVFYYPLLINTERISSLKFLPADISKYSSDISFVGSLYNASLEGLLAPLDDYLKGYINGALEAQLHIYGSNILDGIITEDILERINRTYASLAGTGSNTPGSNTTGAQQPENAETQKTESTIALTRRGLSFAIQKQITYAERVTLLNTLSEIGNTKFYSTATYNFTGPVHQMGPVKYHTQMPAVFKYSKINLCPTLRSIVSGIPLRDLDILACGGVLLTNYQPELLDYFSNGEDLLLYNSLEEAVDLASRYLANESERQKIAGHALPIIRDKFDIYKNMGDILKLQ